MRRPRRSFSAEPKLEAIKLVTNKGYSDFNISREQKYQAIKTLKSHGIKRLCKLFGVSESAYYTQLRQANKPAKHVGIATHIKAIFDESRGSAGKRSIKARLQAKGITVGLYLVRKLMKQQGLFSKQPQKWRYQDKDNGQIFDNILARQFSPKPHITVLCGDTTYLKVKGVWHYLAVVINLSNRQVVGWKLSNHHDANLVIDALNHAMLNIKRTPNMIFHSDQGSIYGSDKFAACVNKHKLIQSMSRRGNYWDNAQWSDGFVVLNMSGCQKAVIVMLKVQ